MNSVSHLLTDPSCQRPPTSTHLHAFFLSLENKQANEKANKTGFLEVEKHKKHTDRKTKSITQNLKS